MADFLLKDTRSKSELKLWLEAAMGAYGAGADLNWCDEDTLCGHFFSSLSGLVKTPAGELCLSSYKIRGRGPGAPEKKLGADGICLVNIRTSAVNLNGFFLFQAKKTEHISLGLRHSSDECAKMLSHTAASYLLVLMRREAHMSGAMAVHSFTRKDPSLQEIPYVSFPRFAVEQLLHGVMMEPLSNGGRILTPELREEIRHVVTIVGRNPDGMAEAQKNTRLELSQLGFGDLQSGG